MVMCFQYKINLINMIKVVYISIDKAGRIFIIIIIIIMSLKVE